MLRRVFKAFHYRDFRLLWFGACTSSIGTWMQIVAQSWLVLSISGSPFLLGVDSFLAQIPILMFSLIGGDLISMPRFVVPMFPGFIALALIGKSPRLDRVILVASLSLQGVLALMFTKGYWIA